MCCSSGNNYSHFFTLLSLKIWDIALSDEIGSVLIESAVKMCPKLFNVQLCRTDIDIKTCIAIKDALSKRSCKLNYIDLSCNRLNDEWFWEVMTGISQNKSLKGIVFWRNSITPYAMKVMNIVLRYNSTLTGIDLSGNHLQNEGIHYLLDSLSRNNTLSILKLSNVMIGNRSARDICKFLLVNTALKSLTLDENFFNNKGFITIIEAFKKNKTLNHISFTRNEELDYRLNAFMLTFKAALYHCVMTPEEFEQENEKKFTQFFMI